MIAFGTADTAVLAANAAVDGGEYLVEGNMARLYSTIRVFAAADQTGTVTVEQSLDGTAWHVTDTAAVAAGTPTRIIADIVLPYVKARFVNGATAQGSFTFASTLAP